MKLLLVDFLRRRWWVYLLIFGFLSILGAVHLSIEPCARGEFLWVVFFTFPWWFDLAGGSSSVTTTLPLSRKTLGLYCFVLGVCVPVVLLLLDIAVAIQVFYFDIVFSWADFVFVALGALVVAVVVCLLLSYFPAKTADDGNESFPTTVWLVGMLPFFGERVESLYHGRWAWLGFVFVGLPATAWAFVRSEKLIIGRARNRPSRPPKARKAIRPATLRVVRPGGVLGIIGDRIQAGFMAAAIFALLIVYDKWNAGWSLVLWVGLFFMCFPMWDGLRLLRTLPLSTSQLALCLLLTPFCTLAPTLLVLAVVPAFAPGTFPPLRIVPLLILAAGAGSLVNSCIVRYGRVGGVFSMNLFWMYLVAMAVWAPDAGLPAIIGWLLGLALYCVGFLLIRQALCSSDSYQARKETTFS